MTRAERKREQVCSPYQYQKVFERLQQIPQHCKHVIVQLGMFNSLSAFILLTTAQGIPIAYPRMNFMETFLDSKLNPITAMAKRGTFKSFVNKFNSEAELLDDLVSISVFLLYSIINVCSA